MILCDYCGEKRGRDHRCKKWRIVLRADAPTDIPKAQRHDKKKEQRRPVHTD